MMNLKLNMDPEPAGHAYPKLVAGTLDTPPEHTIHAQPTSPPEAPAGSPLFRRLPTNACDVTGCKKFGHAFPSPQALLEHKRAVHMRHQRAPQPEKLHVLASAEPTKKKYKCKQCAETFDTPLAIATHVRAVHLPRKTAMKDGKLRWICPHCEHLSSTPSSHANHLAKAHGVGAKPPTTTREVDLLCPTCNKPFKNMAGLASHLRIFKHGAPAPAPQAAQSFIRFTGSKADCATVAMLLIQNGYNNLTTGEQ